MSYDFSLDFPQSAMAPGTSVIKEPVWGGNINGYRGRGSGMIGVKALVLHTPEEAADANEITPRYFAREGVMRSTHYYADNDGDLYQMVSDKDAAWGQGTHDGNRVWKGQKGAWAPWVPAGGSNNQYSLGIEIEGYAGTIKDTLSRKQYGTVARWIAYKCWQYNIPMDRDHIVGHYELATDKTDPGGLPIEALIASAQMLTTNEVLPGVRPKPHEATMVMSKTAYKRRLEAAWEDGYGQAIVDASGRIAAVRADVINLRPPSIIPVRP
jgi:hypothetical protein